MSESEVGKFNKQAPTACHRWELNAMDAPTASWDVLDLVACIGRSPCFFSPKIVNRF